MTERERAEQIVNRILSIYPLGIVSTGEPKERLICAIADSLEKTAREERARVWELEEAVQGFLTRMNKWGKWDDGCFYYAQKAAPELQGPIRHAQRALEGKEEHGTRRDG